LNEKRKIAEVTATPIVRTKVKETKISKAYAGMRALKERMD
jgi:hypothetical protein